MNIQIEFPLLLFKFLLAVMDSQSLSTPQFKASIALALGISNSATNIHTHLARKIWNLNYANIW